MAGGTPKPTGQTMSDDKSEMNFVVAGANVKCTFQSNPCKLKNDDVTNSYDTGLGKQMCDTHTKPSYFDKDFGICMAPGRPPNTKCDLKLYERWFGAGETSLSDSAKSSIKSYNEIMNGKYAGDPSSISSRFQGIQDQVEGRLEKKEGFLGLVYSKEQKQTKRTLDSDMLMDLKVNQDASFQDEKDDIIHMTQALNDYVAGGMISKNDMTTFQTIENLKSDLQNSSVFLKDAENMVSESKKKEEQHKADKKTSTQCMHPLKKESELPCWMGGLVSLMDNGQTTALQRKLDNLKKDFEKAPYYHDLLALQKLNPTWVFNRKLKDYTWEEFLSAQTPQNKPFNTKPPDYKTWITNPEELMPYCKVENYINKDNIYAFAVGMSGFPQNIKVEDMQNLINLTAFKNTGIKAQDIYDACKNANMNPVYYFGKMQGESGIRNSLEEGTKTIDGKKYYNFTGWEAIDSDPKQGWYFAKDQGWDTPEKALLGQPKVISSAYSKGNVSQPTFYSMKYNVEYDEVQKNYVASHQYATAANMAMVKGESMAYFAEQSELKQGLIFEIPVTKGEF